MAADELDLSLSTAWRHRRSKAEEIAHQEVSNFVEQVEASGKPIVVQFDEKELVEDIAGKVDLNCCHLKLSVLFHTRSPRKVDWLCCLCPPGWPLSRPWLQFLWKERQVKGKFIGKSSWFSL